MSRLVYLPDVVTLAFDPELCDGCGTCVEVCPHGVLRLEEGQARIADRDACMECGACMENCPSGALAVQAGVGCAQAVINAALGRRSAACCCVAEERSGPRAAERVPGAGKAQGPRPPDGGTPSGCC